MPVEYAGFQDLPLEVVKRLKERIIQSEEKRFPDIPKHASMKERIRILQEACKNPNYTEKQLDEIVAAFMVFNNAVQGGLPNQLYHMMTKTLDTSIAQKAHAANAIWYAHEGDGLAKEAIQRFADGVKEQIDKRTAWNEEQFHKEYFLNRK